MKNEYDFFVIEKNFLKEKKTFPFQLFIFNPAHKKFSMFLNGNRPLTKEHEGFLDYILEKGGKLAILKKSRTFAVEFVLLIELSIVLQLFVIIKKHNWLISNYLSG